MIRRTRNLMILLALSGVSLTGVITWATGLLEQMHEIAAHWTRNIISRIDAAVSQDMSMHDIFTVASIVIGGLVIVIMILYIISGE